jgi:hypothetical protein
VEIPLQKQGVKTCNKYELSIAMIFVNALTISRAEESVSGIHLNILIMKAIFRSSVFSFRHKNL